MGTFKSQPKNTVYFEIITKMKDPYILCCCIQISIDRTLHLCWDIQIPVEKAVQYPNDFKDDRTLHRLWGHSNSNWKRQFSTEMISKITELYNLWGEIQTPTKIDSLVVKWLQRWQKPTSFVGIFQFTNWRRQFSIEIIPKIQIPIDRTLHLLSGLSNSNMKNSSVSKWFQTWQNLTSDFLWRHSNSNWKMQFSI